MTLFFLLHPPTVAWLPAPVTLADETARKKKKWKEEELMREQKRIRELKDVENILIIFADLDYE